MLVRTYFLHLIDLEFNATFVKGGNLVLPHNENDHNISGILKAFIRDLPDPLFTFAMYDTWVLLFTSTLVLFYLFILTILSTRSKLVHRL